MEDILGIPQSLQEAIVLFSDKERVFDFFVRLRWPNGVTCPRCTSTKHSFISTRKMWKCRDCKKHFSVKVGTLMEDSPLGLDKWLTAMWLIISSKNGISSYEVARAIKITQKSAWHLMHRIRMTMETGSIDKLTGTIEADETYVGGKTKNKHKNKRTIKGRGAVGKTIVMGLLERGNRVVAKVIPDTTKETLHKEVKVNVEKGSNLYTDSLPSYNGLSPDYVHKFVDHSKEYVWGDVHTNGLENFWSRLKRNLLGTYITVEPVHLFRYLNEQAFRYAHRNNDDSERFIRVVSAITDKRLTYKELIAKKKKE